MISRDGLVLTNNHVINGSNNIHVRAAVASGSREYTATVVGYDATHDVALLKISAPNLQPVSVGNSDQVKLGTPVVALGNAEGQGKITAAAGHVTALNATVLSYCEDLNIGLNIDPAAITDIDGFMADVSESFGALLEFG